MKCISQRPTAVLQHKSTCFYWSAGGKSVSNDPQLQNVFGKHWFHIVHRHLSELRWISSKAAAVFSISGSKYIKKSKDVHCLGTENEEFNLCVWYLSFPAIPYTVLKHKFCLLQVTPPMKIYDYIQRGWEKREYFQMKTYALICWHTLMIWNILSVGNSLLYFSLLSFKAIKHHLNKLIFLLPLRPHFHYTIKVWRNALYSFRNVFAARSNCILSFW